MARFDLHSHSIRSDGLLAPSDVVRYAAARGVEVLALTDHDEVAGLGEARTAADACGIALVDGVEVSVSWEHQTLHVVGLNIDPRHGQLCEGLHDVRRGRDERSRRIARALADAGIPDALEGARRHAKSDGLIARTHFARFLVEAGHGRDVHAVFKRYLTPGKPGYVRHAWASLSTAIDWIHGAGGQAVLAHPGRYKLSSSALRRMLGHFRDLGGEAIEVISSSHTPSETFEFAALARGFGLLASVGSDYHGPGESRLDLGDVPELPPGVDPVWSRW